MQFIDTDARELGRAGAPATPTLAERGNPPTLVQCNKYMLTS